MKRPITLIHVLAAMALAAPAAMAGNIVKCVDPDGHVTLTDQPCAAGASTVHLDQDRSAPQPQHHLLPAARLHQDLHQETWRRPELPKPVALASDVATLKAARLAMMMLDARPRLAAE